MEPKALVSRPTGAALGSLLDVAVTIRARHVVREAVRILDSWGDCLAHPDESVGLLVVARRLNV